MTSAIRDGPAARSALSTTVALIRRSACGPLAADTGAPAPGPAPGRLPRHRVVHGTEDRILPIAATADRLPALIRDVRLVRIDGGPHNIAWTHPDEVNAALLAFLDE